ncbi:MAG: DUF2067 domain-containing protein [Desulfurococcaceae archaeon]
MKRFFYIKCSGSECAKLSEIIMENIPSSELIDIVISDNGLYISIHGYKTEIKNIWMKIREIVNSYRSSVVSGKGYSSLKIEYLVRKFKHTFPPILLVFILNKMNYRAELSIDKNTIHTNAPLDIVEDVVSKIINLLDELKHRVSGTTTKYYVVASCILTNKSIDEVLTDGLKNNHLLIDENGKYKLRIDWKRALNEVISK